MNCNDPEHPVRPPRGDVVADAIPDELRGVPQWLCWRYELSGKNWTKVPINARTGRKASVTNPESYADFDTALATFRRSPALDGIGFTFTVNDGYCGVDLDACIADDQLVAGGAAIITELSTYTEISPSGKGVKCFLRGRVPTGAKNRCNEMGDFDHLELYDNKRFFTVTGRAWDGTPTTIEDRQPELEHLCARLWPPKQKTTAGPKQGSDTSAVRMAKREERCWKYIQKCPEAISGKRGHDATLRAACECFRFDLDDAAVWRVMERFNADRTDGEPWSRDELAHKIEAARTKVEEAGERGTRLRSARPPADTSSGNGTKPTILVPGSHKTDDEAYFEISNLRFTDQVLDALPTGTLYRRSSLVGQVVGDPGQRHFVPLTADGLRLVMDRHLRLAAWLKDRKSGEVVETFRTSSRDQADLIIAAGANSSRVHDLRIIVRYPCYLPGFELAAPGLNPTGVLYDEPAELAELKPMMDVGTIHDVLFDLVVDFPFKTSADRANILGVILTAVLLPAIGGNLPLHLIAAPLERTGKTKLASECLGYLFLGGPIPTTQLVAREEEIEKRILGFLLQDALFLLLDNIRVALDSATIASLLTSRWFSGRLLGGSKILTLPNNLILLGTGNNVIASGEMAKRSILTYLQPATAEPERRTAFQHPDLPEYVRSHRRTVFAALLGAVELWKQSGRPRHGERPRLGGFEDWSDIVGGILALIGFPAWRGNEAAWHRVADPHQEDLRRFVMAWWGTFGGAETAPGALADLARRSNIALECFAGKERLGAMLTFTNRMLLPKVDRPVERWIIRRRTTSKTALYYLEPLP